MLLKKLFSCLLPILFTSTLIQGQDCPGGELDLSIVQFNLNSCTALSNGSHIDYSEFRGLSSNKSDCVSMNAIGHNGGLYRQNPSINGHSCTPGVDGTNGMCVSAEESCRFVRDSELAVRFDVEVVPGMDIAQLKTLTFYEKAPTNYEWIDGDSGANNYPTKYGVRVTVEGEEIFSIKNLPTGRDWSLQTIDLSFFSGFVVDEPTIFSFELLAYCPVDNGRNLSIWDLDHIRLYGGCLDDINGGMLSLDGENTELTTCTGDRRADSVDPVLKFNKGDQARWVITDDAGNILDLPNNPPFDFEDAGVGVCQIWNLSYEGNISGLQVGNNVSSLRGCYDFSNPITVNREDVSESRIFIDDGSESTSLTDISLCTNDGNQDLVDVDDISTGGESSIKDWVITDQQGIILEANARPPFNFEGVEGGTCLIWLVSYRDGLVGKQAGENIADLSGCFSVSNSITVIRNQPLAGTIEFNSTLADEIEICAGDGLSDELSFRLDGEEGDDSFWVITSNRGTIISVSDRPEYDFESGDLVTYWVRHLSSHDELQGLEEGNNLDDVSGCFTLSNTLTVTRNRVDAGSISALNGSDETGICIDAGSANMIDVDLDNSRNIRDRSTWLITDALGNILDLPSGPPFDFSDADGGVRLIWHLSYIDVEGLEVDANANDLAGCFELSNPVTVNIGLSDGGTITGGPYLFCVGDGDSNFIPRGDVSLAGATGSNSQWVITDDQGEILGLPDSPSDVNFDDAPEGVCLIWHLSHEDDLTGLEVGNNALRDLEGCFGLSNSIEVVRTSVEGGDLVGGPFSFCVGDGIIDTIVRDDLQLFRWKGPNRIWFVTDTDGNILATPVRPSLVNFDDAPVGTCLVYHGSYDGELEGGEVGSNINDISGCFDLSNPITINRGGSDPIAIEGGPFNFCVGNGTPDMIPTNAISNNTTSGNGAQWVITDEDGTILGLPDRPTDVDFDGVNEGTCLIWLINFDDITGLEEGNNALTDLDGCYSISNSIEVNRMIADGGELQGGPFNFCVGDGIEDRISNDDVNLFGRAGDSRRWLITDESGNILALPVNPNAVDFDDSPTGVCLLWHLSFSGEVSGLEVDQNANDITGCFDLSNPITIVRGGTGDIILEGGPFSFCVGDGRADMLSAGDISLDVSSGEGAQWVITDNDGTIVGLPSNPTDVNFDDVTEGTCLIYFVSYAGDIAGLELENDINTDLDGCFSVSNAITVNRSSASGGELTGGPFNFCNGDGIDDFINNEELILTGSTGDSRRWVITDPAGTILSIPARPSLINFEEEGSGTRLIWHLGFSGDIEGFEVGSSIFSISGCSSLSNPISIFSIDPIGGTLDGGPFQFCVGDGVADNIPSGALTISGNAGSNAQWIVTDESGNILGLPEDPSNVNFDEALSGTCLVWHLSYEGDIANLEVGNNASDLLGCFELSNSVTVTRSQATGGTITGGPYTFCVGDSISDNIPEGDILLIDNSGTNSQWVVTDTLGNILGLPSDPSEVNFDDAPAGVCLVWHLSYEEGLSGLAVGENANDLAGCFSLSNPVTVNRNQPIGGIITGGPFEFCVGDSIVDNLSIAVSGNSGANAQWVITDEQGDIIGLPEDISTVDFNETEAGICLIWHLSFEAGLEGAAVGNNASDLSGCFSLSNSITVTRKSGDDCLPPCEVAGGVLRGGPFAFCVGDEISDNIPTGAITLDSVSGPNQQWVVTDTEGNILGLPADPSDVDFETAGAGECLIWNLTFEDGLTGAEVGNNANQLAGCFDLSNPISVVRSTPQGGTLSPTTFTFCVGDGIADTITNEMLTLSDNIGTNSQFVVTDIEGTILDLPTEISEVNFDVAPAGQCFIWHLSFEDGIEGATVGSNANDLVGCFSLSNPVTVNRDTPLGGTLTGGPFTFCVGDSMPDFIAAGSISLSGNVGDINQWVVTDTLGNILGLPAMPSEVDFEDAPAGTCLIWNLSYYGEIGGLSVGNNANDLAGCLSLSNPITVNRVSGDDCVDPCAILPVALAGGPFSFCVDGVADTIPAGSIIVTGDSIVNLQWVVTDEQGIILGLPNDPSNVNFDDAGAGTCLVWNINYQDSTTVFTVGADANNLGGCYALSNPATVIRNQPLGGVLAGGPFEFCVGDSIADMIPAGAITLTGNLGNSQWVVTDTLGNILGLPSMPSDVNFDDAPAGVCLVWHLSFVDSLGGAEVGMNANDIAGCFSLSNPITVNRNQPVGGTIAGGPFQFCVGDSIADMIPEGAVTLSGNVGSNSQWVVTDDLGTIIGLPASPFDVNFEDAPEGICFLWHLSFEDGLQGAVIDSSASDLAGCFSLSNPIEIERNTGDDCEEPCAAAANTLEGGPFTFCVGDDESDNLAADAVGLTIGDSLLGSQWVITDTLGNIIGLPESPSNVDFNNAGDGTCLIWNIAFTDSTTVFAIGANANTLGGCYALSNPVTVNRNQPVGGTIEGGPFAFCVGDGVADTIPMGAITLSGNSGANSQWVVTDTVGMILGLPGSPSDVNFEDAGLGTCLIWHLSFEDGLMGAAVGSSADSLAGCFSLSNPISVNRTNPEAGTLSGGPFTFCVGDGEPDFIPVDSITLTGNSTTANSQWVITDTLGIIQTLPANYQDANFDNAGEGACLVWHLSFEGVLEGGTVGTSADSISGCFSLSNPIRVNRLTGDNCPVDTCLANGGMIIGGPFEFCVGDTIADMIPADAISLDTSASGEFFQWVVTDDSGVILGLPEDPSSVNFDLAPAGTCVIQNLSGIGSVVGLEIGNNLITEVSGCFALSNGIVVTRTTGDDCVTCDALGGQLIAADFRFCAGDGIVDVIDSSNFVLLENAGANQQWIVTDTLGEILGLPANPTVVNFDIVDLGVYFLRVISFDDELLNLSTGNNVSQLAGCFGISTPIMVTVIEPSGGLIQSDEFSFCVGDGIPDIIRDSIIVLGATGDDNRWIITDRDRNILGLPTDLANVDFDGNGVDTCLIWNISFIGALDGLVTDGNVSDISGCFGLSNAIVVNRVGGEDCLAVIGRPIINEVTDNDLVEIKNIGASAIDIGEYWLCNRPMYDRINSLDIVCGGDDYVINPGEEITLSLSSISVSGADGEMGLYTSNLFANSAAIVDYVQWGAGGHGRESVAVGADIWTAGDFAGAFGLGRSLSYDGEGDTGTDWTETDPNLCAETALVETPYDEQLDIKVFPVPANSEINFELNHDLDDMHTITIFDNYGQLIMNKEMDSSDDFKMNVRGLKAGIYYLRVKSGRYSAVERFIIVN